MILGPEAQRRSHVSPRIIRHRVHRFGINWDAFTAFGTRLLHMGFTTFVLPLRVHRFLSCGYGFTILCNPVLDMRLTVHRSGRTLVVKGFTSFDKLVSLNQ